MGLWDHNGKIVQGGKGGCCCSAGDFGANVHTTLQEYGAANGSSSQRLQNPLKKEYTLSYNKKPSKIQGVFLNEGVLGSLGSSLHQSISSMSLNPKP